MKWIEARHLASWAERIDARIRLSEIVAKSFGIESGLDFIRLAIGNDPFQAAGHKTWQIEPRQTKPFVPNRYFSTAQLGTSAHFDMLAALEGLIPPWS